MSSNHAVDVECYGTLQRVPLQNAYITIDKLKSIVSNRLQIDYPFNFIHQGAELCGTDTLYDLSLNPNHPIRVRRCSNATSYIPDSITDIFLSYDQADRDTVTRMKTKLEEENYLCWLDVEQISGNADRFSPAVERGIQKSTVFLACITNRYAQSTKRRQELSYATQQCRRIILLLLEELHWPPPQIAALVSGLSNIDFYHTAATASSTPWLPVKFEELLTKLGDLAPQL